MPFNLGLGLQAMGAGFAGRDPSAVIQQHRQGIEREERKGNIAALMGQMGISGPQRALLDIMPQEAQIASLYEQQQAAQTRAAQEAANARFYEQMGFGGQQGITQEILPPPSYSEGLATTESGGRYDIVNAEGYGGKYQFGQPRLDDYNRATGQNVTMDQFLADPQIQEAAQEWNVGDTDNYISKNALDQYIGQNIGGVTMTQDGLRAMAHLGGNYGMRKFLESGGQYNPADSQGTRLSDYAQTHAGGMGAQPAMQPEMASDPKMLELMMLRNTPNLGAGQQQYLDALIKQRQEELGGDDETTLMQNYGLYTQQEQAAGRQPLSFMDYQQELKAGTTVTVNTGPTGIDYGKPDSGFAWARDQAGTIVTETDPETGHMRPVQVPFGGGKAEAAIAELEKRDVAAAEQARIDLASRESDANAMLSAIDTVLEHPNLENILGPIEGMRETFFTQGPADAFAAAGQLGGKVFMEAYEGLKGGGQITEIEGRQATNAIARLQRTQSPEAYKKALNDLRNIVVKALERVGGQVTEAGQPQPSVAPLVWNPNTGAFD